MSNHIEYCDKCFQPSVDDLLECVECEENYCSECGDDSYICDDCRDEIEEREYEDASERNDFSR